MTEVRWRAAAPADRRRAAALAGTAVALVAVPTLGPALLGTREEVADEDTPVTPPGYAFVVWAPIFAGALGNAVRAVRRPGSGLSRAVAGPLATAYGLNAGWSIASQAGALRATPTLLPAATGAALVAHRRAQGLGDLDRAESVSVAATGLLLGWTSLASTINALVGLRLVGLEPEGRGATALAAGGLMGASVALAREVRRSRRGGGALATSALWGLGTLAADRGRPRPARAFALVGAALVATSAARSASRGRG